MSDTEPNPEETKPPSGDTPANQVSPEDMARFLEDQIAQKGKPPFPATDITVNNVKINPKK